MVLVVGIGNPGSEYEATRHNVGFMVVDTFAARRGVGFQPAWPGGERHSLVAKARYARRSVWLAKPQTFVNCSGPAVLALLGLHGLTPADCLVVLDDVQLPLGRLRIRGGGSDGGHNGLVSVLAALGTDRVPRLRVGVGAPAQQGTLTRHVLGPFGADERPVVSGAVERAADCVETWVRTGLPATMNEFNAPEAHEKGANE